MASYCQMRCHIVNMEIERHSHKGWAKNDCFFRPTSYVNISETVYPIYLKMYLQRQLDNLTHLSFDMKTKVVQHDNYQYDNYDYHDNYHNDIITQIQTLVQYQ